MFASTRAASGISSARRKTGNIGFTGVVSPESSATFTAAIFHNFLWQQSYNVSETRTMTLLRWQISPGSPPFQGRRSRVRDRRSRARTTSSLLLLMMTNAIRYYPSDILESREWPLRAHLTADGKQTGPCGGGMGWRGGITVRLARQLSRTQAWAPSLWQRHCCDRHALYAEGEP